MFDFIVFDFLQLLGSDADEDNDQDQAKHHTCNVLIIDANTYNAYSVYVNVLYIEYTYIANQTCGQAGPNVFLGIFVPATEIAIMVAMMSEPLVFVLVSV